MVSEVLEAVHHLDTSYAAFYTAMTSERNMDGVSVLTTTSSAQVERFNVLVLKFIPESEMSICDYLTI